MTAMAKHSPKVALIVGGFVLVTSRGLKPSGRVEISFQEWRCLMSRGFMFDCLVGTVGAALALLAGGVGEARAVEEVQKLTASDAANSSPIRVDMVGSGKLILRFLKRRRCGHRR